MASRIRTTLLILASNYALIVLNLVTGILLVPLYLEHLGVANYGAWLATGEVLGWLAIVDPGLGAVLQQRVASAFGRGDFAEVGRLAGAGYFVMAALSLVIGAAGWLVAQHLQTWLSLPPGEQTIELVRAYLVALAGMVLLFFSYASTAIGSGLQRAHAIGGLGVAATAGSVVVTVVTLLQGQGLLALAYGALFRGGVQFVAHPFVVFKACRHFGIRPSLAMDGLRNLFHVSAYNALSQWATILTGRIDSVLLTRVVGPEAAASLALTRRGPLLLQMVAERPSYSAMPTLSELTGRGETESARHIAVRIQEASFWVLGLGFAAFLSLNAAFVRLWVGTSLFAGVAANALVCAVVVIRVGSMTFGNYALALGNIRGNAIARSAEAGAYVGLVILGARFGGILGMVAAELVSLLLVSSWYYPRAWMRLAQPARHEVASLGRELATALVVGAISAGVVSGFNAESWGSFAACALLVTVLYTAGIWLCSARLRDTAREFLRRAWTRSRVRKA